MSNTLLGCAIGDTLGMPFEKKLCNDPLLMNWNGKDFLSSEHHKLQPGQWTDDTQFSLCVAQSLIDNREFNPEDLSNRYIKLFASKTIRGYGKTTELAINNLLNGKSYKESGVVGSYGNGTAMRAAPFGIWFRNDLQRLVEIVKVDSAITHASEEAEAGAIAIALAAAYAANRDLDNLSERICEKLPESKVKTVVHSLSSLVDANHITPAAALSILGTKADVRQTVPAALYCFMRCDGFWKGVETAIRAGGDADTTAAIVGALFGARDGTMDMLSSWIDGVEDSQRLIKLDSQLYNRSGESFFPRKS